MGDLTHNFSEWEFRCRDGATHSIDCRLLGMLEGLRAVLQQPITITSGYRSKEYNKAVGGARDSYHLRGMAADIQVRNYKPRKVYDTLERLYDNCGLGLYERGGGGWVHLDSRLMPARWRG